MKQELDKIYLPNQQEDIIYKKWLASGFFNPDNLELTADAPNYTIILPPPNITAKLHAGHSSMLAIEDLLIRFHRLRGDRTLWLPGTDHAAIATQNVVEKQLLQKTGQTRHDLGRTEFLKKVYQFVTETQNTILHQIKKMGASLDWSRLAFTLDETRQHAVNTMFLEMYQEGVIYRGERVVNWCPRCQSTLADDELEYQEQQAKLYTFKYDHDFPITISTTRPETKLGDVAVAVNPQDQRYKKYLNREYQVNFCGQKLTIKIISDRQVEQNFGTGALGVTPAHSLVDWQIGEKYHLPVIKVIDEQGIIRTGFGKYSGLNVQAARLAIVADLKKQKLLEKEEEITNNLSVCYRCQTPVEPLPSRQWFINVNKKLARLGQQSLREKALEVVQKQEIEFIPKRFTKTYSDWMKNLHDWCISRQIWYGHPIPVWYCQNPHHQKSQSSATDFIVSEKKPEKCSVCGGQEFIQDPDTLDTWFSSGMWTFSTLGWPNNFLGGKKTGDLAKYHPTQVLETGYEIVTLWVSRMVMMSLFALGEIPFEKVYLHGTVLDSHGKKMSKSTGNGIDPLEVIDKYGADALRLALLSGNTPGNNLRYQEERVEAKRNFINKLWNISRFILSSVDTSNLEKLNKPNAETLADYWILEELNILISKTTKNLEAFNFSLAAESLQEFTWNKLADWYLEIAKIEKNKEKILIFLLKNLLILWHPFIPYVTESIWSSFNDSLLLVANWPSTFSQSNKKVATQNIELVQEIVVAIRNLRNSNKISPANKLKAVIYGHQQTSILKEQQNLIQNLKTGLVSIQVQKTGQKPPDSLVTIVGEVEIYLLGDLQQHSDAQQLITEKNKLEKLIINQEQKLANSNFVERAPQDIVLLERDKLKHYRLEVEKIIKLIN